MKGSRKVRLYRGTAAKAGLWDVRRTAGLPIIVGKEEDYYARQGGNVVEWDQLLRLKDFVDGYRHTGKPKYLLKHVESILRFESTYISTYKSTFYFLMKNSALRKASDKEKKLTAFISCSS